MIRMARHTAAVWLCLLLAAAAPAFAAVTLTESVQVTLLRGSTTVATLESWDACLARARELANASTATTGTVSYVCQTERRRVVATYSANPPPPAPVDCAVSAWSDWAGGAWSACSAGSQSRLETRTRTVTVPANNGGSACPALTESRTVTQACSEPPPPSTSANPLYPALDMATVPFHVAAGAYGPQLPFQTAALPVITRSVTASSLAELQAAMSVPGTRVTVTANILGGQVAGATFTDVEVVIPNGRLLRGVAFGSYGQTVWNRVRFTKAPGDVIGGQVHQFLLTGTTATDWIIDGLQISGGNSVDPAVYPALTVGTLRGAILRNRIVGANAAFGYGGQHLLVAGNSVIHDANGTNDSGDWGFRNNSRGPHIYVDNDIRGGRYAHIRFHPAGDGAPYYIFAVRNTLVDRVENRSIDINDTGSSTGYPQIDGAWLLENRIYVNGGLYMLLNRSNGGAAARYVRANSNQVFGATSGIGTGGAPDGDATGNVYTAAPGSDPAWQAAGDPSGISLSP